MASGSSRTQRVERTQIIRRGSSTSTARIVPVPSTLTAQIGPRSQNPWTERVRIRSPRGG
jgi:hypothetical protein